MNPRRQAASLVLPGLAILVVVAVIGYVALARDRLPTGPTEIVWDKTACAECQMHVGDPGFAAQVQTTDGRTLAFDDPGCLFRVLPGLRDHIHAVWFHHLREARWLSRDAVAFLAVEPTPMGYGLGAVDPGTPGAIPLADAERRILEAGR